MARTFSAALSVAVFGIVMLAAAPARAQTAVTTNGNNQIVSTNPFFTLGSWYNLEFERRHTSESTFGIVGSTFGIGDARYRNVQAFYRYYPQGEALSGFYVGGRLGGHRVAVDDDGASFAGAGVDLGYTWLLGARRHFAVSLGGGATRLFGGALKDVSLTVPNLRANIGWGF